MPSTTINRSMSSINYCFLLKCLAGVALAGFIIAMLMKPTYIVVAAAAAMAPALGTAIFLPLVALLALTLLIGLAASIPSATYVPGPRPPVVYPWYQPAGWFGPTYANYGWFDYMFGLQPANYHARNWGGTVHSRHFNHGPNSTGGNLHGHTSAPFYGSGTTHSRDIPMTSASTHSLHNHSILRTNYGTGVPPSQDRGHHAPSSSSQHGHR